MGKEVHFYTLEEAIEEGVPYREQSELTCECCGKSLEQLGIVGYDGVIRWVIRKECDCEEARVSRENQERQQENIKRKEQEPKLLRAGIPKRYLRTSVTNAKSIRYIESYQPGIGTGLYFLGGVGAGKTYKASALAKSFESESESTPISSTGATPLPGGLPPRAGWPARTPRG